MSQSVCRTAKLGVALVAAVLLAAGCRAPRTDAGVSLEDGRRRSVQIHLAMTSAQLEALMGPPDRTETRSAIPGEETSERGLAWIYDWRDHHPSRGTFEYVLRVFLATERGADGQAMPGQFVVTDWTWEQSRLD
jgi:hypothetical protein